MWSRSYEFTHDMNPFFFTAIKPLLERPGYGLAVVSEDCDRIVAFWGRKAQPGKCTFEIHDDNGTSIVTYSGLMHCARENGFDLATYHWIANHTHTNQRVNPEKKPGYVPPCGSFWARDVLDGSETTVVADRFERLRIARSFATDLAHRSERQRMQSLPEEDWVPVEEERMEDVD
jgi:hypothetical protein